jgi:hypothetical protein
MGRTQRTAVQLADDSQREWMFVRKSLFASAKATQDGVTHLRESLTFTLANGDMLSLRAGATVRFVRSKNQKFAASTCHIEQRGSSVLTLRDHTVEPGRWVTKIVRPASLKRPPTKSSGKSRPGRRAPLYERRYSGSFA